MAVPVYKVFSLVIRVFSKPLVAYTKKAHLKSDALHSRLIRGAFVGLGGQYHRLEGWMNVRFMGKDPKTPLKKLSDELALEKGIEFFYEILFYSLIIGLPLYELYRGMRDAQKKTEALNDKLEGIDRVLEGIIKNDSTQALRGIADRRKAGTTQSPKPEGQHEGVNEFVAKQMSLQNKASEIKQTLSPQNQSTEDAKKIEHNPEEVVGDRPE